MIAPSTQHASIGAGGLRARVTFAFALAFGTASSYVVNRSVADAQFLTEWGPVYLPYMYLGSALILVVVSSLFAALSRPTRSGHAAASLMLVFAAVAVIFSPDTSWAAEPRWGAVALYLLAELRGGLGTILLAMALNERFSPEESKSHAGVVGCGATLAGILFGSLVGIEATEWHARRLIWFTAGIDVLTCLPLLLLARAPLQRLEAYRVPRRGRRWRGNRAALGWLRRHLQYGGLIAAVVSLKTFVGFLIDYLWKTAAAREFPDVDQLIGYFGWFYSSLYVLTAILQLTVTRYLLNRPRSVMGVLTLPLVQGGTIIGVLISGGHEIGLGVVQAAKACDAVKRAVGDPVQQILYGPLPLFLRRKIITLVTGVVKPLSEAIAGAALIPLADRLHDRHIAWLALLFVALWTGVSYRCARLFDRRSERRLPLAGERPDAPA